MPATLSPSFADTQSLAFLAQARRDNLSQLFLGTELVLDKWAAAKNIKDLLSDANDVRSSATDAATAASSPTGTVSQVISMIQNYLSSLVGLEHLEALVQEITPQCLQEVARNLTPFVGPIINAAVAGQAMIGIGRAYRDRSRAEDARTCVQLGAPQAALAAVVEIIEREIAENIVTFSRSAATAGAQVLAASCDLGGVTGPVLGAVNAFAGIVHRLFLIGRDFMERKAANKLLAVPDELDATVFNVCPILGCYLLTCSDSSNILSFFVADVGLPGWMDRVEKNAQQVDAVLRRATDAVRSSRFVLQMTDGGDLVCNKGTFFRREEGSRLDRLIQKANNFKTFVKSKIF